MRASVHPRPGGAEPVAAWTHEGAEEGDLYGFSASGAGDVNADGFGDVLILAAPILTADVLLGGADGLPVSPVARLDAGGTWLSSAGDVDRDGRDDVLLSPGKVYLASTFLDASKADPEPEPWEPPETVAGCGGEKGGCSAAPGGVAGPSPWLVVLWAAVSRRRLPSYTQRRS